MRGISEKDLREKFRNLYWSTDDDRQLLTALLTECKELNPWLPIENAPKECPLWLFNGVKVIGQWDDCLCEWSVLPLFWGGQTFDKSKPFTHYQKLPDDPK